MSLYEFTFIVQQSFLEQEVEELIQELGALLKSIKLDILLQQIKEIIFNAKGSILGGQELEICTKSIEESVVNYSNFLEDFTRVLWLQLEKDLSNLKEVKLQINKELKNDFKDLKITQDFIKFSETDKKVNKSMFIRSVINSLKENILKHLMKLFREQLINGFEVKGQKNRSSRALEVLLVSLEASGLIKYEYCGLLDFAYPINKMKSGHYCIMCISSTSGIMDEFNRRVKLNENIIRSLSVRVNKFFEGRSYMINKEIEERGV
ncbi:MAG: 30S ribosomal protein S6 [Wolbachia endosymbiont of Meromenopon meropis]|nr:30S ribosomal protein S6 [Wolbachia endosymbiont of Meromenopon meropis]